MLNFNGEVDTARCLASMNPIRDDTLIVVVDNGSRDESAVALRAWCSTNFPADEWIHLKAGSEPASEVSDSLRMVLCDSEWNRGFAGGFNFGWSVLKSLADVQFVASLNNDTLLSPADLSCLADTIELFGPRISGAGPLILDDAGGDWQRPLLGPVTFWSWLATALLFSRARARGRHRPLAGYFWCLSDSPRKVHTLPGSCIVMRQATLERIGGMDERFFFYWDEFALAERVHQAGESLVFDPRVSITHLWGRTVKATGMGHLSNSTLRFFEEYRAFDLPTMIAVRIVLTVQSFVRWCTGRLPEGIMAANRCIWQSLGASSK